MRRCKVEGCERKHVGKGYCNKHYLRITRYGTIKAKKEKSIKERILERIQKQDSGCWEWQGCKNNKGYGQIRINGKLQKSHRISYQIYKGAIPKGMFVLHKCDNPSCVNPGHLFIGTNQDNVDDKMNKKRHHCGRGEKQGNHKLTGKQVIAIAKDMRTYKQIAKDYNVTDGAIHLIKRGKNWSWLTGIIK